MFDFFKITNLLIGTEKIQYLLDFEIKVNTRTGEELTNRKKSAYLKNLIFTIPPGGNCVKVQGSLHKYANGGQRNNDLFTYKRFLEVYNALKDFISPDDQINVIEFGVNIKTPFDPSHFIKNLISHRDKQFNKTINQAIEYSQTEYSNYIIKIYNKGLQQGPEGANILRIEVKYLKMQKLFPNGLKWSDLANIKTWSFCCDIIRKKFAEIIYYDPSIDLKTVSVKDRIIIERGHNPIFWEKLSGPHVSRIRKQYQNLIRKYGKMFDSLPELFNHELKEMVKSYHFSDTGVENVISSDFDEVVKSYPLLYGNFSPTIKTSTTVSVFCCVTGIDISMQKPGSKFLCITGIKKLYESDRNEFEKLKSERLSPKWKNEPLEVQIREIAHSIRNEYFNPKYNTKRSYCRIMKDPALFDNWQLIRHDKKELILLNNKITNHYCNGT